MCDKKLGRGLSESLEAELGPAGIQGLHPCPALPLLVMVHLTLSLPGWGMGRVSQNEGTMRRVTETP
jgi:hypothetical protein